MKFDGVFEGGGVKLPALAGAYEAVVEAGFTPSHMAGTSAGAITAAAIAAGYTPAEVKKIIMETNFNEFLDGGHTLASKLWNLTFHNGIYKGDAFYNFIKDILLEKNVRTFKDLRYEGEGVKYQYRLKVMASDVTSSSLIALPQAISQYGIDPDDLEVALAVRMSMSIPFFFRPVILDPVKGSDATTLTTPSGMLHLNDKHAIVDGGLLSNFPIWTWDDSDEPAWPTFGFLLYEDNEDKPRKTNNPITLTAAIFASMMKAHDKQFIRPDDFINRTISIPTGNISSIDFGLSQQRKGWLYKQGYDAATEFLQTWNWNKYKRWAISSRSRS